MKLGDKLCMICGGSKLVGRYFGAITCDSCKSFFRRMALKNIQVICLNDGNCNIIANPRKLCQKCRLEKCLAVGMRKELIRDVKENERRRQLIRENKLKQQNCIHYSNTSPESNDWPETSDENSTSSECPSHQSLDIIYNNFQNVLTNSKLSLKTTNVYDLNLSVIPVMKPITDYNNQFNELEGNRLTELLDALKIMMNPMVNVNDNEMNAYSVDPFNLILRYQENGLQNTVKMAKRLNAFKSLCDHDQLTLIKYASIEIVVLRIILNFDFNELCWSFNILSAIILFNPNRPNLINKTAINIQVDRLLTEWQNDSVIMELLAAIILFNPNVPDLAQRNTIM
ncbi:unnamed protein product [Oppiella nova]|uniref:Uncharacterized protein n=1 Tax=Oppiella nova TaxID=334625 RepID=A0A7R9QJI2_9ACAR|nr:unnamed protein product [Oppiella nova]CAG2167197.1 unnamed protein product [Oppiella nova]